MIDIVLCRRCLLWKIGEETHFCPLENINYVGHCEVNGQWYIDRVSKDGKNWQEIKPIPSFMVKEASSDESKPY